MSNCEFHLDQCFYITGSVRCNNFPCKNSPYCNFHNDSCRVFDMVLSTPSICTNETLKNYHLCGIHLKKAVKCEATGCILYVSNGKNLCYIHSLNQYHLSDESSDEDETDNKNQ